MSADRSAPATAAGGPGLRPAEVERERRVELGRDGIGSAAALAVLMLGIQLSTLSTPYYWDETLWIRFALRLAEMPLWSALPGFDPNFIFGNRPVGLFLPVAAVFKLTGPSVWLPNLWIAGFAAAGVYFTVRLGQLWFSATAGLLAGLLLLSSPLYLVQAGFFLADLPVAALGVTAVYLGLTGRRVPYLLVATAALLLKETAAALVLAFAVYRLVVFRDPPSPERGAASSRLRNFALDAAPLVLIGAYYVWQRLATGHFFVHYPYAFEPFRFGLDQVKAGAPFLNRWLWWEQGRWMLTVLIGLALLTRPKFRRRELLLAAGVMLGSGYSFLFLYFLPRYSLPVAPFFSVVAAGAITALAGRRRWAIALAALPLALALRTLDGTPLQGNGEWNLGHRRVIQAHQALARELESGPRPAGRLWAPFPVDVELRRPALGYVSTPFATVPYRRLEDLAGMEEGDLLIVAVPGSSPQVVSFARERGLVPSFEYTDQGIRIEVLPLDGVTPASHRELSRCARDSWKTRMERSLTLPRVAYRASGAYADR